MTSGSGVVGFLYPQTFKVLQNNDLKMQNIVKLSTFYVSWHYGITLQCPCPHAQPETPPKVQGPGTCFFKSYLINQG